MAEFEIDPFSADYDDRMKHARAVSEWHLGSAGWANILVGAFLWPDPEGLEAEKEADIVSDN